MIKSYCMLSPGKNYSGCKCPPGFKGDGFKSSDDSVLYISVN